MTIASPSPSVLRSFFPLLFFYYFAFLNFIFMRSIIIFCARQRRAHAFASRDNSHRNRVGERIFIG